MLTFAFYILKVIICSGILYGYYLLALRNKIFHRWNRFYLLAAVVLSLAAPLIKINIWQTADAPKTQVIQLLETVSTGDEIMFEYTKDKSIFHLNTSNVSIIIYIVISGLLLAFLIQTLLRINRLKKNYRQIIVEGVNFFNTNASGTPFSFFNNIFWNDKIDINSPTGKQIFRHEVAHIQEKHSHDKIFINIVLIFFWINPIYWLIRKELNIIHEFIADKKALEDSDTAAFAAMILQATYPQEQFSIANNFYYSPLKRRLAMLTKNKNPKVSYITRILVLPLAALVFLAFTLKMKTYDPGSLYKGKIINVVIDAGHGGDDNGAVVDNIKEKDLTLAIAKEIKELNKNEHINIILSREEDQEIGVKDRVKFAEINKADLFISIHIDAAVDTKTYSGLNIFIPKNDNPYLTQSRAFGSAVISSFKNNYGLPVTNDLRQRDKGVFILKENQSPAVLIEAGFLTNPKDLEFLIKPGTRHLIAKNILQGIEKYAKQLLSQAIIQDTAIGNFNTKDEMKAYLRQRISEIKDNDPKKNYLIERLSEMDSIPQYYKGKKIKQAYGSQKVNKAVLLFEDGTRDTIQIAEAEKLRIIPPPPAMVIRDENLIESIKRKHPDNVLIIVDGVVMSRDKKDINGIPPNSIQSISVLKGETAIKKYGDKGKDGVIEIITKQTWNIPVPPNPVINNNYDTVPLPDKIFTKTETEASFPGGNAAWARYIKKLIEANINELTKEGKSGTCRIRFIVNTDGTVSNVIALTMQGTKLAEIAVEAIRKGPRWTPATQNGRHVAAYRDQPITFTIQDNDKVFTKVEVNPSFPGGDMAWAKYIKKIIETHINELANENKSGTCRLRFIVNSDGTVSNVTALSMQETKLAEIAVDAIRKGPKWNPATQNGQVVAAYKEVPVTFTITPN